MERTLGAPACHRLAGRTIWIDPELPELQPFRLAGQAPPPPIIPTGLPALEEHPPAILANGWLADHFSRVSLWWDEHGTLMEIPAAGLFWTARDGSSIYQVSQIPSSDPTSLKEALLGPPLVLALAIKDTWCLHASAIEYGGRVIAFLGESGTGKSTLAAALASQPGVRRMADDILPVVSENHGVFARPHFPQLKLPIDQQPGLTFPEIIPLTVIYLLEERPTVSIGALGPVDSALILAAHSVATRLFDRQLLSQHLAFCSQAASLLPIRRLAYPRIHSKLPMIWKALQEDLAVMDA